MAAVTNATPLISLDAVAIDTETTGLDPRKAHIVEIGAVKMVGGEVDGGQTFRRLVRPPLPIPAQSTEIHGIDDNMVSAAPDFAGAWADFVDFAGDAVLVGHTVGFDLSVIQRECERSGIAWKRPQSLCTHLLTLVAEPDLGGLSLEQLANRLGVPCAERHSALGDAVTAAHIFKALIPLLRDKGIRTLAEARQAIRALTEVLERQHRAGWAEVAEVPVAEAADEAPERFDTYPYRRRIRDVMTVPPRFIPEGKRLEDALAQLMRNRISSLFVVSDESVPDTIPAAAAGIVTERDILRAIAGKGDGALQLTVGQYASRPLISVPADDFVYRAIGRMTRMRIRHLAVTDDRGDIVGALSARDLLRLRVGEAISLGDEIDVAKNAPALGAAWAKLASVCGALLAEGLGGREIAAIVSRELCALTRKAAVIAERRMLEAGEGEPPCAYAMTVLGSAGRGESLLAMDQDNAIVFARGAPDGAEDKWFARLGQHVADILNEVGVPYCKGGVMASNAPWRGSVAIWKARIADWITRSRPQDLMSVDIFFDMRAVHGRLELADGLWREAFDMAKGHTDFAKLLAEAAGRPEPGLGLFGRIRTTNGRIDLKRAGLFGIVSTARVLAIQHHVLERATPARLAGLRALDIGGDADIDALIEAHATFLDLILSQQLEDIQNGKAANNKVAVRRLSARERERLQSALQAVRHLDHLTRQLLFGG
jgi:CBS domain-containing protein